MIMQVYIEYDNVTRVLYNTIVTNITLEIVVVIFDDEFPDKNNFNCQFHCSFCCCCCCCGDNFGDIISQQTLIFKYYHSQGKKEEEE